MTGEVITFGCRMNTFESEVMRGHAAAAGLDDVVIVNTCAVTAEAERQARQTIRRIKRGRPEARVVVTGCAAELRPDAYAAMPEVDRVLGNGEKLKASAWGDVPAPEADDNQPPLLAGFAERTRAFMPVQQGCDHACTFCIIPAARGPSRSAAPDRVLAQARRLVAGGYRELVLTGVDITAYGQDLAARPTLGGLVRRLLAEVEGIARLRLTSLDTVEIDADLLAALADEPRLMPHIHLSIQAGDDLVLKRMLRRHDRAQALATVAALRRLRPGLAIGADLIAGFPTETEAMFANTLALVAEVAPSHLHVFPYSPRPGTPAARMPAVNGKAVRARAAALRAAGETARAAFLAGRVGAIAKVLVEKPGFGHCEHYLPVRLPRGLAAPGDVAAVRIAGVDGDELTGAAP